MTTWRCFRATVRYGTVRVIRRAPLKPIGAMLEAKRPLQGARAGQSGTARVNRSNAPAPAKSSARLQAPRQRHEGPNALVMLIPGRALGVNHARP